MTLTMTAIGWLDELNHRWIRADEEQNLIFADRIGGEIAQTLLLTVNSQRATDGVTQQPTHLSFISRTDTQTRTRSYKRGQSFGQAIQELSDIENGFDIRVDPVTRGITTLPPTAYADLTDVVFGYGVAPFNLANAPQNDDGTNTAERVTVVGANGVAVVADDTVAAALHGGSLREDWISGVSDSGIIGAYANSELVYRLNGQITYDLKPLPYGEVPRLYDDFELGDKVYLSIDAGALKVDRQAMRVFSVTIDVDAQGNEVISSIGTAPQ
jgi:hypothetical protein